MSTAERNREIKKLLAKAFAPHKVSVTGGRGTAYGRVDIHIGYAPRNNRELMDLRPKVEQLIRAAGIKLGTYYADDGYGTARSEILVGFDHCREKADYHGPEAWKHNLSAEDWDAMQKREAA